MAAVAAVAAAAAAAGSPKPEAFSRGGPFRGLPRFVSTPSQLASGADILHLEELDQKLWVALSCPVKGLFYDERTLDMLDSDRDGRVRVPEILGACKWLGLVLKLWKSGFATRWWEKIPSPEKTWFKQPHRKDVPVEQGK